MKSTTFFFALFFLSINFVFCQTYEETIKLGETKFAAADYIGAVSHFQKSTTLQPNSSYAHYALGLSLGYSGTPDKAITQFDKAIEIAPDSMNYYFSRGEFRGYVSDLKGAIKDLEMYAKNEKDTPQNAYALLAANYYLDGDINKAKLYLDKTENSFEELPANYYYTKASIQLDAKEHLQAIQNASKAINMAPQWGDPYFTRAKALYEAGKYEKSIKDYDVYIEKAPNNSIAYSNRGLVKEKSGDKNGAFADYAKSISLYDQDAITYLNRGTLYIKMKDYDKALSDLNKAAKLAPKYSIIFGNRANVHSEQKNYEKAVSDYNIALEINPSIEYYIGRSTAYLRLEKHNDAYKDAMKVLEFDNNHPDGYLNGGIALFNLNKFDEALSLLNEGIEKNPKDGMLYYTRSAVYKEIGENTKAAQDDEKSKELLSN